jgi:hypothetical protein
MFGTFWLLVHPVKMKSCFVGFVALTRPVVAQLIVAGAVGVGLPPFIVYVTLYPDLAVKLAVTVVLAVPIVAVVLAPVEEEFATLLPVPETDQPANWYPTEGDAVIA